MAQETQQRAVLLGLDVEEGVAGVIERNVAQPRVEQRILKRRSLNSTTRSKREHVGALAVLAHSHDDDNHNENDDDADSNDARDDEVPLAV